MCVHNKVIIIKKVCQTFKRKYKNKIKGCKLHHNTISTNIVLSKGLNSSCSFIMFLDITLNCEQIQPLQSHLRSLLAPKSLDLVAEITADDPFLRPR